MVDRISLLPDEVLCHILSFLPTKKAVATSVLSKKWRPLWILVPTLDYDDEIYLVRDKPFYYFEKLVYETIRARDAEQPIRRFRLKYDSSHSDRSDADVNAWLKVVIPRRIENLDINLHPKDHMISLNCCIFSCTTLVVLKLKGISLNASSSSVELPSLKSLHLEQVKFTRYQNLTELFHGCPILQDLKAHDIDYDQQDTFCVEEIKSLPKLLTADLHYQWFDIYIPLKAVCNVEYLSITKFPKVEVVPEFPNLMHMNLHLLSWDSVYKMLKNSPKLQVFEVVSNGGSFVPDPHIVPECLTSQFRKCSVEYYNGTPSELRFAKYIMENSTTLQTMMICSMPILASELKDELFTELASCQRRSALCELSFK
ncbi:F-box/FBD/LRR-repeat protein At5g56420-like [Lotus japonicus]|uniref:F-box/FBD/LRR-repeat protein At5g56420-like n=1 Tax=Lotus japonicus TaxID=34305 RepID=UPI002590B0A6|nr:F-box/FBD/LRR-repeat protein At5g56420-like [Lotus japonicus]